MKLFIPCGGGLGDVIQVYLSSPHNDWEQMWYNRPDEFPTTDNLASLWFRRLESFKKHNPGASIIVKSMCHNSAVAQLFEFHPCIDRTDLLDYSIGDGWTEREFDGYTNIRLSNDYKDYDQSAPVVYLDYHERCYADIIIKSSKYIVMHPFAGAKEREVIGVKTYNKIADRFIDAGYSVVVVGSVYQKNVGSKSRIIEEYDRKTDNRFFNLVGFSVREFIYLILNSSGFVGTHSSMILPAWYAKKRSVCISPTKHDGGQSWEDFASEEKNPTTWGFRQPFNKSLIVGSDYLSDATINDIVGWVDENL